jgi:hypothetical protein
VIAERERRDAGDENGKGDEQTAPPKHGTSSTRLWVMNPQITQISQMIPNLRNLCNLRIPLL